MLVSFTFIALARYNKVRLSLKKVYEEIEENQYLPWIQYQILKSKKYPEFETLARDKQAKINILDINNNPKVITFKVINSDPDGKNPHKLLVELSVEKTVSTKKTQQLFAKWIWLKK